MYSLIVTIYINNTRGMTVSTSTIEFQEPALAETAGKQWVEKTEKALYEHDPILTYLVVQTQKVRITALRLPTDLE
jgi:hypothetical protein